MQAVRVIMQAVRINQPPPTFNKLRKKKELLRSHTASPARHSFTSHGTASPATAQLHQPRHSFTSHGTTPPARHSFTNHGTTPPARHSFTSHGTASPARHSFTSTAQLHQPRHSFTSHGTASPATAQLHQPWHNTTSTAQLHQPRHNTYQSFFLSFLVLAVQPTKTIPFVCLEIVSLSRYRQRAPRDSRSLPRDNQRKSPTVLSLFA